MKPCEGCGQMPVVRSELELGWARGGNPGRRGHRHLALCPNPICPYPRRTAWHDTIEGAREAWDAGEVGPTG